MAIELTTPNVALFVGVTAAVGGVVAGLISGAFTLASVSRASRNDGRKWMRQERFAAYVSLIGTGTLAYAAIRQRRPDGEIDALRDEFNSRVATVIVLGPQEVSSIAERLGSEFRQWRTSPDPSVAGASDDIDRSMTALAEAARRVLDS